MKEEQKNPKVLVILGATSTGKSDFAVELAHFLKEKGHIAEIISADSRQVYTGLDLGTGKITQKEMRRIPHHMLDVVSPRNTFSVAQYQKKAQKIIQKILKQGHIPIITGGTGFYIDALVDGIILPEVPPNKALRNKLSNLTNEDLFMMLKNLDKERAETVDWNNKVRLIRAIEIATTLGKVPKTTSNKIYDTLKIGLAIPDDILKKKIQDRLAIRMRKGMLKEIQEIHEKGISWKRLEELGLEYRYGALYLQKKITKEELLSKLSNEIWHYTKRQKTWFKRDDSTLWINPQKSNANTEALQFLRS